MRKLTILLACAVLGSCAKESISDASLQKSEKLQLVATLGSSAVSRASILGNQLPEGAQLGVSVLKTRDGSLYNSSVNNIPWVDTSTGWSPSVDILLNDEEGTAYAYYPYSNEVTDIETIPIVLDQTDYCWGSSQEKNLSNNTSGTSKATIVLEHALTRIALKVYKKDYPDATLSRIQIRSKAGKSILCTTAEGVTFNAKTGEISGVKPTEKTSIEFTTDDNSPFVPVTLQNEIPLSPTASTIILPTSAFESGDLEFVLTVNNKELVAPISKPQSVTEPAASGGWHSKYSYTYEVQLTGAGLVTTGASFIAWVDVPNISLDIDQSADYSRSADGKFLFYKKQSYEKIVANDVTSLDFVMYSNEALYSANTLSAFFSKEDIYGGSVEVTSEKIASDVTETDGEKVLGDWKHKVKIKLKANLNDTNPRKADVTLLAAGSIIAIFGMEQGGVDTKPLDELLVEIGGLSWMPFNTSGILANDVAIAKEIIAAGDIVTYAYAKVENWRNVSGVYFTGAEVLAEKVCPTGYRVPKLQEYTDLFGDAVPVRPGELPKWLASNPTSGNMQLPHGVLSAIPHPNTMNLMNVYWHFVSNGRTLPFIGAGTVGKVGTNLSGRMNEGIGIWTSTERTKNNLERVAPWQDGWANNTTSPTAISQVRCVKK